MHAHVLEILWFNLCRNLVMQENSYDWTLVDRYQATKNLLLEMFNIISYRWGIGTFISEQSVFKN